MNKPSLHTISMLEAEVAQKNNHTGLMTAADPLRIAKPYRDDVIALVCALFAYGNAKAIEKFLLSLDFSALDGDEESIEEKLKGRYYRLQTNRDVTEIFKTFAAFKKQHRMEDVFLKAYRTRESVLDGLGELIRALYDINPYRSRGYEFLLGKIPSQNPSSAYKRWNLFLRWMVRDDALDMGLWKRVKKSSLLIPLDTHTFNVSKGLGLLRRKTYDFKAVLELTETLRGFDADDPIKYDFAIYRLGQSRKTGGDSMPNEREQPTKATHSIAPRGVSNTNPSPEKCKA
ncbi:MAG: TIGR02757 family protein [Azoarcus sp.]|nr:TIGR02757 family protein [Azoarcus sp.]